MIISFLKKIKDLFTFNKTAKTHHIGSDEFEQKMEIIAGITKALTSSRPVNESEVEYKTKPIFVNNKKDKTILFLDDLVETRILLDNDLDHIKNKYGINILEEYNVIICYGGDASYVAKRFIENEDYGKIDYAFVDLTMEGHLNYLKGTFDDIDGIDIYEILLNKNPEIKVKFLTAHVISRVIDTIDIHSSLPHLDGRDKINISGVNSYIRRYAQISKEIGQPTELIDACIYKLDSNRYEKIKNFIINS